ncbi:hypothetical protein BAE44_0018003 [Dichanthelium oligosanthes]|uniref:Uncharacterized protein n=1 Tax=Dichanthelium oligosanthes TaxID=888268 RepID=A0A1E5V7F2_9POAL|nr:hypothetical protein BAE44_0018003 [Dichanthelium oligosanthes]
MKSWARKMAMAGFKPATVMSYNAFADSGLLALQRAVDGTLRCWVTKEDAYIVVQSRMTPMFSVTAWRPARKVRVQGTGSDTQESLSAPVQPAVIFAGSWMNRQ